MNPYSRMSSDDFDRILRELAQHLTVDTLLAMPGVYEGLAEELTNDVLRVWDQTPAGVAAWAKYHRSLAPTPSAEELREMEPDDTREPCWTGWNSVE